MKPKILNVARECPVLCGHLKEGSSQSQQSNMGGLGWFSEIILVTVPKTAFCENSHNFHLKASSWGKHVPQLFF